MRPWSDAARAIVPDRDAEPHTTKVSFHRPRDPVMLGLVPGRPCRPFARRRLAFLTTGTKRVLILVEDYLSVLRALRRLTLSAGFRVMAFDGPSAALDSVLPQTNACLVVDMHSPEMNGAQLCAALATTGCQLPVIMITGRAGHARGGAARQPRCRSVQAVYPRLAAGGDFQGSCGR